MGPEVIEVYAGPMVGNSMIFVPINFAATLLSLLLIIRIGKGRLNLPVVILALGMLIAAVIPVSFGKEFLWIVPIIQTISSALTILSIMKVFGVFSLITSEEPKLFLEEKQPSQEIKSN